MVISQRARGMVSLEYDTTSYSMEELNAARSFDEEEATTGKGSASVVAFSTLAQTRDSSAAAECSVRCVNLTYTESLVSSMVMKHANFPHISLSIGAIMYVYTVLHAPG